MYSPILEKGVFFGFFLYRGLNTCYKCYRRFQPRGRGSTHCSLQIGVDGGNVSHATRGENLTGGYLPLETGQACLRAAFILDMGTRPHRPPWMAFASRDQINAPLSGFHPKHGNLSTPAAQRPSPALWFWRSDKRAWEPLAELGIFPVKAG